MLAYQGWPRMQQQQLVILMRKLDFDLIQSLVKKHKSHHNVADANLLNDMKTCGKEEREWECQDIKISAWHNFCTSPCTLRFSTHFQTIVDPAIV